MQDKFKNKEEIGNVIIFHCRYTLSFESKTFHQRGNDLIIHLHKTR